MRQPPGQNLKIVVIALLAALLSQNLGCAQTPFVPFSAPDLAIDQWLTPNPPQKADLIGQPYVIEFWASWCPPCQKSIRHMIELQDRHSAEGLIIIALAQDSAADKVRTFISQKNVNYNVAMDSGNSAQFGITQIPTVFVVDHSGQVVWRGFPWDADFDRMVRKVLDEAPPSVTSGAPLGQFENYKARLRGGPGFAAAYRDIKAQSETTGNPNAASARSIILAIDLTITRKTNQAHVLRHTEPASAYRIYAELVRKYGGIPVTQPAVNAMAVMKEGREIKPDMYAAQ